MRDGENSWTKRCSRVVDQRNYRLPPAWTTRLTRNGVQDERGRAVHISGRERKLANRIVSLLAGAREKVVLSSFLLADREMEDAILAAARRGVRAYILLASEARLDIEDSDGEFETAMRDQHRKMLRRLGGHALFRSAPHFHAKFVLADPGAAGGAGLLLTANLTREALERNEELGLELTREEVDTAFALARWAFWEYADHELVDPTDRFRSVKPLDLVTHPRPAPQVATTTSESRQLCDEAARLIESARGKLVVSSFGWDKDHEIVQLLCARAREGLPVTVLARTRASQMRALVALAESGARVLGLKWLHAKALYADNRRALVMSANLQPDGLDRGFELGVKLDGDRAREVGDRLDGWCRVARWELLTAPALSDALGETLVWRESRLDEMKVVTEIRIDLGSVTAASADKLDDAASPDLPSAGELPEPSHAVVYEWRVRAPVLAANSKQVLRPSDEKNAESAAFDPPVFREPSGRRVVAIDSARDIEKARRVANSAGATAIVVQR